nr:MAG TPA: hypothetical protein [Bacteriophage sp.]
MLFLLKKCTFHFEKMYISFCRLYIEEAIIDSARTTYLATSIEKSNTRIDKYNGDPNTILTMELSPSVNNKVNKLKKILPEAFFYWVKTSELLQK